MPTDATARRGVPQGDHLHNLLTRAQRHLEDLIPGFGASLRAEGASVAKVSLDTYVYELGVVMPRRDLGLELVSAPRPMIDHVARRQVVTGDRGVQVLDESSVTGIMVADGVVEGVTVESGRARRAIDADLVIDASGAGTRASRWLEDVGFPVPAVQDQERGQWYATTTFERPAEWVGDPTFFLVFPTSPNRRGGLVSPLGPAHWTVSVNGRRPDPVPRTIDDVLDHVRTLEDPAIARVLDRARCIGDMYAFRRVTAHWRRYDTLDAPLPGFLPLGDAIASLNPLYGQGMSIAAWQAHLLRDILTETDRTAVLDLHNLTVQYLHAAASAIDWAWDLGALIDQELEARPKLVQRIFDDPEVHRHYLAVWHLLEPASSLGSVFRG